LFQPARPEAAIKEYMKKRIEKDTMGALPVDAEMLYGAQTARAVLNFQISGRPVGRDMIAALGRIKKAAARVNRSLGLLDSASANVIEIAADEVISGALDAHFPVDVFQTGSGTSSNMNANEVIANRAVQLLGGTVGSKEPVHPNDHVNLGQSSNDVFPAAIHLAAVSAVERRLLPVLRAARDTLEKKSRAFSKIVKTGRTHLQDAVLMTAGQEMSAFAAQISLSSRYIEETLSYLRALPLGGTAVGTGVGAHPEFGRRMAEELSGLTGTEFVEASNHFEAQAARDAAVRMSGALKAAALSLMKIANDIRFLASGPRLGLGELKIPAVQPGSSIMPGKVNPVIAEALMQVCAQVIGNDAAVAAALPLANFQLHAAAPLIARNLLEQIQLLENAVRAFDEKLLKGLMVDERRLERGVESSLAAAVNLMPRIGYDRAAEVAKKAEAEDKTVLAAALEMNLLPEEELRALLNAEKELVLKKADSDFDR
jgi:fumarate hydratase, class II